MTFTNRKTAREALATGIATNVTSAQTVYNYIPNNIYEGGSPVITVSSLSWFPRFQGSDHDNTLELLVTVWIMRINKESGNDYSADAEDELDNVSKELLEYLETWNAGILIRGSESDYAVIDGWQYRTESHFVHVEHYEGE
jgi:hypothetical protein